MNIKILVAQINRKLRKFFDLLLQKGKIYQIAIFVSLLIALQGLTMFFVCLADGNPVSATISISYSILMFITFLITLIKKNLKFFFASAFFMMFALEIVFLITGGSEGFGVIWILVFPIFTLYVLSSVSFVLMNLIFFLILIAGFWTPLSQYIYPFSDIFKTRFPLVYALIFLFGIFLKYKISSTEAELSEQKEILSREIQMAAAIQKAFLSNEYHSFREFSIAFRSYPFSGVTGDIIDFYADDNQLKGVGLFDISGHGVSSGLLTVLSKNLIHDKFFENFNQDLSITVSQINEQFIKQKGKIDNYLTGILLKFSENKVQMVNAGHPYPVLYKKAANRFDFIIKDEKACGAIGLAGLNSVYVTQEFSMESGDILFLFTDGFTDTYNRDGFKFEKEQMIQTFSKYTDKKPEEIAENIINDLRTFQDGASSDDDTTILIIKKD